MMILPTMTMTIIVIAKSLDRHALQPSWLISRLPVAPGPALFTALAFAQFLLTRLPSFGILLLAFSMKVSMGKDYIELIHLDPVLQRFCFPFAGSFDLLHLPTHGILQGVQLARLKPSQRFGASLQHEPLPLVTALQRVSLNAVTFGWIEFGICAAGARSRTAARASSATMLSVTR